MIRLIFTGLFMIFLSTIVSAQGHQEISVKAGETKTDSGTGIRVNFIEVVEDSRCPKGVNCFWAGQARIKVTIEVKNGDALTGELATIGDNQSVRAGNYRVHLVKLDPHPSAEKAPEQKEYSALFRFEKL